MVRLWGLESGDALQELTGHGGRVTSVAFSPDGRLAYAAGGRSLDANRHEANRPAIEVWDLETHVLLRVLPGPEGSALTIAVSPDGRRLLTGGIDKQATLSEPRAGGSLVLQRLGDPSTQVRCAAFLPDGRRAVTGDDRSLRLWDLETGRVIREFPGHTSAPTALAVSPDGRRLLSSAWDSRELRLWDVETGQSLQRINWGVVHPTHGCFTPDGREALWAGYEDGIIRMYRLTSPGTGPSESARHLPNPREARTP
jgi:WD40 repeat protein